MHKGRPYGLHVIGEELTDKDNAFISATAMRFTNLKNTFNVETLKLVYELPDGGSFIIQDAGNNFRVIANKPPTPDSTPLFDGVAKMYIPMLFSGAVYGSTVLRNDVGLALNISKDTQRRLANYDSNIKAPAQLQLMRFVCEYGPLFQEFMPDHPVYGLSYTQYGQQRPTWYSGAMSEVMQIVGGYGKQNLEGLPDDKYERARFELPPKYYDAISEKIKDVRLPAYSGLPNADGQYQYDYKSRSTNLVSFDDGGNPWLLRVDSSGVWVMPLPVIPATTTTEFYEYIETVGDTEIQRILDRFGGMPSGEGFPQLPSAFQAWRRAGVITKVCETKEFYKYSPYSTAMGWSSNVNGTEAVNTAYDLDWDTGRVTSVAYKMRIKLEACLNNGWLYANTISSDIDRQGFEAASSYLSLIYQEMTEDTPVNAAIKYKLRSVGIEQIKARASNNFDVEIEIGYWNNLEIKPLAQHKVTLVKIDEGIYFAGGGIKVPEPILKGCISIPQLLFAPNPSRVGKKDTTVLAYYIGDILKTVKLFQDDREHQHKTEGNFEQYMYVGKWWQRELSGSPRVSGNLYISDIDDRQVVAPKETLTDIEGKDLGYSLAHLQMDYYFWRTGTIWRNRWYTNKTNIKTVYDKSLRFAVTIPYFCRDILLYAKTETQPRVLNEELFELKSVRDPYSYRIWSDNEILLMFGGLEVQRGTPYPVDGKPVYAEIQEYRPRESNAWANEGPWVASLPSNVVPLLYDYSDVIWAYQKFPPPPPADEYKRSTETKDASKKALYCQVFEFVEKIKEGEDINLDAYYSLSPDIFQNYFYKDACKVVFGDKRYANLSEVTETGNRKQWGESLLVDNKSAHHFIGVINE